MTYDTRLTALAIFLFSFNFLLMGKNSNALPLPSAPDTGTPKGNSIPGTTRSPEIVCPATAKPLTALVANNGKDYTLAAYPNFWFYIPYNPTQINSLEFLLLDGEESQTLYKTTVKLTDKSGIIKIALPQEAQYALKVGQKYHWYFLLDCSQNPVLEPDLAIDGWIERISPTLKVTTQLQLDRHSAYLIYENNQIWFDAIDSLASSYFTTPDRPELKAAWAKLWRNLNYQWLIPETLVGIISYNELDLNENKQGIKQISLD
jgi:Domain of Unknown Function (DUF928)